MIETIDRPRLNAAKASLAALNAQVEMRAAEGELIIDTEAQEIYLFGRIGSRASGGIDSKMVAAALKQFKGRAVTILINSPGGSVTEGVAVHNAIKRHGGRVTAVVDGLAASIASFILVAAPVRLIARNSTVMIHNPWSAFIGDEKEMLKEADLLAKFGKVTAEGYATATGKTVAEIQKLMADETWYFGQEAIDAGFCTALVASDLNDRPRLAEARKQAIRLTIMALRIEAEAIAALHGRDD